MLLAAAAAFAFLPAPVALADAAQAHEFKAKRAMMAAQKASGNALFVTTDRAPQIQAAGAALASRRLVYVDGVLIEMDEEMIRGQVDAGAFTVVYPGTSIPWKPSDDRHPNYPPDWF
jgi:hypothetical protein